MLWVNDNANVIAAETPRYRGIEPNQALLPSADVIVTMSESRLGLGTV